MSEALVVIGNGMAAARLVEELSKKALGRYAIAIIGEEPRLAYNRVLLSSVLSGDIDQNEIDLKPAEWWRDHGVTLRYGCKASAIDLAARSVKLADGKSVPYSKLVIATGSHASRLPLAGAELAGVHTFRDVSDIAKLARLGADRKRVVVIGGGLLGLEAAYGLAKRGAKVTLVHIMDRLMERQLDAAGGALLARLVEQKGVRVLLNASATRIHGQGAVESLEFRDGAMVEADAVVFAVGVKPNVDLARMAGVGVNRGVLVDDGLATNIDGVFALGECVEHRGVCYGLVEPAYEQARVLASRLAGRNASYAGSVTGTNLKVSGVNVFSAGDFLGGEKAERIIYADSRMGHYKKLVLNGDRVVGAVLIGDTGAAPSYLDLIRTGADVGRFRDELMFGDLASVRKAA
jgi:nitrite reductase (NADH) large subunit